MGTGGLGHPVALVAEDDPEMDAAMETARASAREFMARAAAPAPGEWGFSVKAPFTASGGFREHIWINDLTVRDGRIHGTVGNEPVADVGVKIGDPVSFAPEEISDWMYIENDLVVGAYTTRVLRARMSAKERRRMDEGMSVRFD